LINGKIFAAAPVKCPDAMEYFRINQIL